MMDIITYSKAKQVESRARNIETKVRGLDGYYNKSTNLADYKTMVDGYSINGSTGELQESSNPYASQKEYVRVVPSAEYLITMAERICFYGYDKRFLRVLDKSLAEAREGYVFETPSNCYYIRFHTSINSKKEVQLNRGRDKLPFEEYYVEIDKNKVEYDIESVSEYQADFLELSSNLVKARCIETGKSLNSITGELQESGDYSAQPEYLPVSPGDVFVSDFLERICFYGKHKTYRDFKETTYVDGHPFTFSIPEDCFFLRYHVRSHNVGKAQLNKGGSLLEYEPYYVKFKDQMGYEGISSVRTTLWLEASGINKDTGEISNASDRDYETSRRTGKFLRIVPGNDSLSVEHSLESTAYLFEYDSDFHFLRMTEVPSSGNECELLLDTRYVKMSVESETNNPDKNIVVEFFGAGEVPEKISNERYTSDNISFTYEVVSTTGGREVTTPDSTTMQYAAEKYYNSGLLKLPPNYDPFGEPVKLIVFCHGAGSSFLRFDSKSFGSNYEDYFQYLSDEGYALLGVYNWTTKYEPAMVSFGSPIAVSAIVQGCEWVFENYNVDRSGVFISGKSAGGYNALNFMHNKGINVSAVGLFAPAISPLHRTFGYSPEERLALADDFGFEGDTSGVLGIEGNPLPKSEELTSFIRENARKMVGYNPFWNGLIGVDLEDLSEYGADRVEGNPGLFDNISRYVESPVKIWVSEDDASVPVGVIKNYLKTVRNGQGIGELRLLPDGTGGHNSTDSSQDAMKVENIITDLGISHSDVPLAYVELVQFFRRFH